MRFSDECYLVLFHTPLFTFVRPLVHSIASTQIWYDQILALLPGNGCFCLKINIIFRLMYFSTSFYFLHCTFCL
jgi:hypothetical protein